MPDNLKTKSPFKGFLFEFYFDECCIGFKFGGGIDPTFLMMPAISFLFAFHHLVHFSLSLPNFSPVISSNTLSALFFA